MKSFAPYLLIGLLFTVFSCNRNTAADTDNLYEYQGYIVSHTFGNQSIAEPVRIELAQPVTQLENNQTLPAGIINTSPKLNGTWFLDNNTTLRFQPEEYLERDKEYAITIALHKLFENVPKDKKTYTFSFKTLAPDFKLSLDALQSYDANWQYAEGVLEAADILSLSEIKKLVSAQQKGNEVSITWPSEAADARFFTFTVDSIQRKAEASDVIISWDGSSIGSKTEGNYTLEIPGKKDFVVVGWKTSRDPQDVLTINFSDPLLASQDFSGLVTLSGDEQPRFETNGNVLYVYPSTSLSGEVALSLFNGIKNAYGTNLSKTLNETIQFEPMAPAVRLVSKGVILPNAAKTPIFFETVNLSKVDVRVIQIYQNNMLQFLQQSNLSDAYYYNLRNVGRRVAKKTIDLSEDNLVKENSWTAHGINLSEFFKAEPGALYQVEFSFEPGYVTYPCNGALDAIERIPTDSWSEAEKEEQYWDNEIYRWRDYTYNWQERDNPCHEAYYHEDRVVRINVLGSDLGMIVKKGSNASYHFATTNIISATPESGVSIQLYNFQQQLVETVKTDSDGLTLYDSDRNIAFAVAKKGDQYAYAKLSDGNALSYSQFDISGKKLQKGLKGFLYTERGVHRPGDSLHLTFVLNDLANPIPKGHPVVLDVTDARGKLVQRTVQHSTTGSGNSGTPNDHFYYFPIATDAAAPSGTWNARITVGGVAFTKALRVATIKPNRLKINLDFDDEVLDATKPITGTANALWLHGAPARNLKIEMEATLRTASTPFEKFKNYQFQDPVRSFEDQTLPVLKSTLSAEGSTSFSKKLEINRNAPGMLQATFLTKVFEGGGDFSIDVFSKPLAPYAHFVGIRSPETDNYGSYTTAKDTSFEIITVDAQGVPSGNRQIDIEVFQIEWRWWWNRGNDNLSRYENATVHRPYKTLQVTSDANGKAQFSLNIPKEEGGRFLIRAIDKASGHATGRVAYFYDQWWRTPSDGDSESAKMLVFSSDKDTYQVGEEALITFPSGSEGRALLSIENGTEVLQTKWIRTQKGETQAKVKLNADMTPNVYVNISLLQPHEQTKNDLPVRLYGVIPISVENPKTILEPKLSMPSKLKPEETFTLRVSEANNKSMTYTVAIVDEGLLDLTRFQTPAIHDAFYSREALGVKTFDIFDDVIGAYSGSVNNIYAIGGGDAAAGAKNRKADRFPPVVRYLGPFHLTSGETAQHQVTLPNYVGSVRTMVIAGNAKSAAYGSAETTTPVRKPLMVLASVPRVLSPGEKVTVPVTVFAMEPKVKQARIQVTASGGLKPVQGTTRTLQFNEVGEQIVNFEFEVGSEEIPQQLTVKAFGSGETASYNVEVAVANPNPISLRTKTITLTGNQEQTISFEPFGVDGSNSAELSFSTLPPMEFTRRMEYLIRYPHGCVEQTTSAAFPQLFLDDIFDVPSDKKQDIQKHVERAIQKLGQYQIPSGGMAYWPGEQDADAWSTNYVGHFMLEAKKKGYALPISFLSNWLRFQKNEARQWRNGMTSYNSSLTQAYRLYTLALAGEPELAAMNRLRESKYLSNEAKWRLAAAYAIVGKSGVANELRQTATISFEDNRANRYNYGSPFRNKAMALETMVLLGDSEQRTMAETLARNLSSGRWYSTQETAYALLALAKMVVANGGKELDVRYTFRGTNSTVKTPKALASRSLNVDQNSAQTTIRNNKDNTVYVTLLQRGRLPLGQELAERNNLQIKASYLDGNGASLDVASLRQGTEINATVTVTNTSDNRIDHLALSKIFPGGWEIVNTSFTELGGGAQGAARYTDIRDDRVHFYFSLNRKESKTFTIKLNASYLGTYYLPGTQVEAMYDASYYARNKGMWVTVKQ
tara:strand:+ start:5855 stop:11395 length:5541 start_codon:yes stop_codon:yes gene_type:complete